MSSPPFLRIGTRGSPLALYQANETRRLLAAAHRIEAERIEIVVIRTSGDAIQDRALSTAGGKGLFTREIEEGLLGGGLDLAVHSAKDMPTVLPDGLLLAAYLEREDVRDALIAPGAMTFAGLPEGAVVGTASLRRQALVKRFRPDLKTVLFRGNVDTRLRKLSEGVADATLLALAGLKRLGLADRATALLDVEDFPPAVGQGAIAIEARQGDQRVLDLLAAIDHPPTATALRAERAYLAVLDGSCRTPIAGHATLAGDRLAFHGLILTPDGGRWHEARRIGSATDAEGIGREVAEELRAAGGPGFFAQA